MERDEEGSKRREKSFLRALVLGELSSKRDKRGQEDPCKCPGHLSRSSGERTPGQNQEENPLFWRRMALAPEQLSGGRGSLKGMV